MIRIISYTRLLILVLSVGVLFGCSSDIVEQKRQAESRYIRINGYPKGFSEVEVSTRSGKNEFETKLSTLYMLIFDANGQLVDVPSLWKCHFTGNTQYPVSYPICAYAVFNTHYAVFRGYIHDLSSVERIQKK